jgi:hypothetical protein
MAEFQKKDLTSAAARPMIVCIDHQPFGASAMKESRHKLPYVTCQYCQTGNHQSANFCRECQYPAKLADGIATQAPESLVEFARLWHGGQTSALYSVLSTGSIWHTHLSGLESELRYIVRKELEKSMGESIPYDICGRAADHLDAIEALSAQLPEESE